MPRRHKKESRGPRAVAVSFMGAGAKVFRATPLPAVAVCTAAIANKLSAGVCVFFID